MAWGSCEYHGMFSGLTCRECAAHAMPGMLHAAPFHSHGQDYMAMSPRTGRMVSQAVAEAEFSQSFDAIPTREHQAGGLWDFEKESGIRAAAGCRLPTAPERYDAATMQEYADHHSGEFTDLELQVYTLFWCGKLSYGQIGRQLGRDKARIRECVQRLRDRMNRK